MSTHELNLTLVGWLGTEPRHYPGGGTTTPFTTFRMASTRRWFDREKGEWIDARTEWFTVKAWRQQADNVAKSLRKSDPVIVHGRFSTEEWTGPEGARHSSVLEAIAIGPDLTFGKSDFARTVHLASAESGEPGPNGGEIEQPSHASQPDPWATSAPAPHEPDDLDAELDDDLDDDGAEIGSLNLGG